MNNTQMIKDTFELFIEPFNRANVNRDTSLERDSTRAAVTARFQYLAQIIVSIVSIPFLLLAGLCDLVRCDCKPLNIPLALFSQLFIVLPISFFSLITPLSWSQGLDKSLSKCTRDNKIKSLTTECLSYLNEQCNQAAGNTIEREDLEAAIPKKNDHLKAEALKKSLTQLKREVLAAPRGSILQSDLYEMIKKKEEYLTAESRKTVDELYRLLLEASDPRLINLDELRDAFRNPLPGMTDTLTYHNVIDCLARKRPETLQDLLKLFNPDAVDADPIEQAAISRAITLKYAAQYTLEQLEQEEAELMAPTQQLTDAISLKRQTIEALSICEKIETLSDLCQATRRQHVLADVHQKALHNKTEFLEQLSQLNSFETMQREFSTTKNPVHQNDLKEAIIQKYLDTHSSYYALLRLCQQASPTPDPLLQSALARKEQLIDDIVASASAAELEAALLNEAPDQNQDPMEALRRKYYSIHTLSELEAMATAIPDPAAPRPSLINEALNDALKEKKRAIQTLATTESLAALMRRHNQQADRVEKDVSARARDKKQTIINDLCNKFSLEELHAQHHRAPNGLHKTDLQEAKAQKLENITQLVRGNTLQQLQGHLAAVPENEKVTKQDMAYAVREKQRQMESAAKRGAAATAVAQPNAGMGAKTGTGAVPPTPQQGGVVRVEAGAG